MKPLFTTLALFALTAPVWANIHSLPEVKPQTTADGITITALPAPEDDVANILGIEMWRFRLEPPQPNAAIYYRLELRRPGQLTLKLSDSVVFLQPKTEFTFALAPLQAPNLRVADTIKIYSRFSSLAPRNSEERAYSTGDVTTANPIKDLKFIQSAGGNGDRAWVHPDGTIVLMDFNTEVTPERSELVLVLTAKTPAKAK